MMEIAETVDEMEWADSAADREALAEHHAELLALLDAEIDN